jgi:hypothetical protein
VPGVVLNGDTQILFSLMRNPYGPSFVARLDSEFCEMRVLWFSLVPRRTRGEMRNYCTGLQQNTRFIKDWKDDRRIFVLLKLLPASLVRDSVWDSGKQVHGWTVLDHPFQDTSAKDVTTATLELSQTTGPIDGLRSSFFQPDWQTSESGEADYPPKAQEDTVQDKPSLIGKKSRKSHKKRKGISIGSNGTKGKTDRRKKIEALTNEIVQDREAAKEKKRQSKIMAGENEKLHLSRLQTSLQVTKSQLYDTPIGKTARPPLVVTSTTPAMVCSLPAPGFIPTDDLLPKHAIGRASSIATWQHVPRDVIEISPLRNDVEVVGHYVATKAAKETSCLYSELPIYHPGSGQSSAHKTEIRLIELMPAYMGDGLLCNMRCVNLDTKPQFLALSYTWGGNAKTHSIQMRGFSIPVTINLYQALLQLRKPLQSIVLWVDALCINQESLQETNYQVTQMQKIYTAAQEVIIWLGNGTSSSDHAMDLIGLSPQEFRKKKHVEIRKNLDDLFCRPYWSRVWVVQELASANRPGRACTLRCGHKSVTLVQFKDFLRRILHQTKQSKLQSIMQPKSLITLSTQDSNRTFLHVLWESSFLVATNPCDKIYGIRGISPKFYRDNIAVNYDKTITFEKLSEKVLTLLIKKERSLDVLCCFHRCKSDLTSPSWLRDFQKRNPGISPEMYSSNKGRKANAEVVNRILRTRGVRIGRVSEITTFSKTSRDDLPKRRFDSMFTDNPGLESEAKQIETRAFKALRAHHPNETRQSTVNRFLEMIMGGRQQAIERLGKEYKILWRTIWDKRIAYEEGFIDLDSWRLRDETFYLMFNRLIGRCLFTTHEGNVGLGPGDMRDDDIVSVLFGCRLPVVLRRHGRFYEFIGPAYVDSAMNGEFIEGSGKGERFWIR